MDNVSVLKMLQADFLRFHKESLEISELAEDLKKDASNYIQALMSQIKSGSVPLFAKTPKISKKKGTRIKAIPENSEMESVSSLSNTESNESFQANVVLETSDIRTRREKRGASVKAADIIKRQQSINLTVKLRERSHDTEVTTTHKVVKEVSSKRPKGLIISSDDEETRPSKQSKIENKKSDSTHKVNDKPHELSDDLIQYPEENDEVDFGKHNRTSVKRKHEDESKDQNTVLKSGEHVIKKSLSCDEPVVKKANNSKSPPLTKEKDLKNYSKLERISEVSSGSISTKKPDERITRSSSLIKTQSAQKSDMNNINESMEVSDETVASMYEDAVGKPIPIMHSTMNLNTTTNVDKMMNVTVLIEPLSSKKILNETITIKKSSFKEPLSVNSIAKEVVEVNNKKSVGAPKVSLSKRTENLQSETERQIGNFNELITDDDSSPERKEYKSKKELLINNKKHILSNSSISDEDEILRTPMKLAQPTRDFKVSSIKSVYKKSALFSPYAKDSVKKRVEAFEQVAISPKQIENETVGRVTRTKTRAIATVNYVEGSSSNVKQKLARKSLAKAKKISLAKQVRDCDDTKENEYMSNTKYSKSKSSLERSAQKYQSKTTPLGKSRMMQMPSSISKLQHTPLNTQNYNAYSKPLTGSRGNIVTHVDSFIQPMQSATKTYDRSTDERRRKANDEDARRKREELLKAQAEEKRRKREEKELKNKLAREAKEKLDFEKRLKAEKDKEEKAKMAQLLQEKQKEELEKKRTAQLQRAQEKEEKRKQEQLIRLQRIQEQEEQERLLAEQRRREQEMEKRKQAEMRHQMAELKLKNQLENKAAQQAKAKALVNKPTSCNYIIDSDPDEEESDDENEPKYQIPTWASKNVRQSQLAMQQHIPIKFVLKFFDAKKCTPDLRDLFHGIDPMKLKRSSSAIWKTPPRFSMMNCSIIKD